jgi:hypothetical protein
VSEHLREGDENAKKLQELTSQNEASQIKVDYLSYDWNINSKN